MYAFREEQLRKERERKMRKAWLKEMKEKKKKQARRALRHQLGKTSLAARWSRRRELERRRQWIMGILMM